MDVDLQAARELDLVSCSLKDFEFHGLIMRASGNSILVEMHQALRDLVIETQRLPLARHSRIWEVVNEHEAVLEALARHDPVRVTDRLQRHIERAAGWIGVSLRG